MTERAKGGKTNLVDVELIFTAQVTSGGQADAAPFAARDAKQTGVGVLPKVCLDREATGIYHRLIASA